MFKFFVALLTTFVPLGSDTITKLAPKHPYRTCSKSRVMGEVEEVQEHMKVDMSVLKNQMASIMEAMLSMRRLIESNTATATATSTATEADLVLPSATNQANQLAPDMVGRGRDALGNTSGLHRGITGMLTPMAYPRILHHLPCTRTWILPFPLPLRGSLPSL